MSKRERADVNTGVRLTYRQVEKANRLANQLGISRNRVIARLIEQAQVVTVSQIEVIMATTAAPVAEETANVHPN